MIEEDWTAVGIQEAASKYAVNLPAYFEGRDNKGDISPYVAPEKPAPTIPAYVVPVAKIVGIGTGLLILGKTFVVGIAAIFAWLSANQVYSVGAVLAVGAGVAVAAGVGKVASPTVQKSSDGGSGSTGGNITVTNTTIIQR